MLRKESGAAVPRRRRRFQRGDGEVEGRGGGTESAAVGVVAAPPLWAEDAATDGGRGWAPPLMAAMHGLLGARGRQSSRGSSSMSRSRMARHPFSAVTKRKDKKSSAQFKET